MTEHALPPALRLIGPSGCGKTTLGERLVATLGERGYRVATVKSAQKHPAPEDRAGSDTDRYRSAGAVAGVGLFQDETIVRFGVTDLDSLLLMLAPLADLVLVEGFRDASVPALVFVPAPARGLPTRTIGLITPRPQPDAKPPQYHRDDIEGIAAAVEQWAAPRIAERPSERSRAF